MRPIGRHVTTPAATAGTPHAITPPLRAYFDQLAVARQPRILIPGAGRAYEAEYLHQLGFRQVFVADLAPEPLAGASSPRARLSRRTPLLADFFALPNAEPFDLIVEQTFFCALDPARARPMPGSAQRCCGPAARSWACCSIPTLARGRSRPLGATGKNTAQYFAPVFRRFVTSKRPPIR